MQKIGYVSFIIGASGMDSNSIVPAIMVIAGLTILATTALKEKRNRP